VTLAHAHALLAQAAGGPPEIVGPQTVSLMAVLFSAAITDNILLTRYLGMCPFLSVSRQLRSAVGMGLAVVFVTTCTCAINALLYVHVLAPLGAYGVPAESLKLILFIIVIAAFVQLMEMLIERISLRLYFSLGIFLPLITVNCAILGASLFMLNRGYTGLEGLVFGFGSGAGWMIAIVLMAGIRERLKRANVPPGLEGPGITLIIAGIMAMAFIGFSGVIKL
jgi:Na+-transporting NADH:ubiquinone oxidoreductase subunit E